MESELAKTLRSMSDDHRMVPDFSEQLLDIADTIERLQKERDQLGAGGKARFVHVYREDRNNQTTLPGPNPYGEAPEYAPITSD